MNFEEEFFKSNKNYNRNLIKYLLVINSLFFINFKFFKNNWKNEHFFPYSPEIKKIVINNGEYAKIGIISDFQLDSNHIEPLHAYFKNNLLLALNIFKEIILI